MSDLETFVSLDLETTGTDAESDRIIEIGAVKFRDREILESFHTLVNPFCPLPYRIRRLTGISQREVDAAPPFAAVVGELISFVGGSWLIGQNLSFDLGFLSAAGVQFSSPFYDTQQLARLLLPQLLETSLSALAQALGISCSVYHRALPDAITAKDVFLALREKAWHLDLPILGEICRLSASADWMFAPLFQEINRKKEKMVPPSDKGGLDALLPGKLKPGQPLSPRSSRQLLDPETLAALFSPQGALASSFPGYEYRPGQLTMMRSIAQCFNDSQHLVVEAGTGTGKSLAYLLPAVQFARGNNLPVLVSTNTINLQEQLMNKDIPDLLQALGVSSGPGNFRVAQLKGRSNYLCLRRWNLWRQSMGLKEEELHFLMRTLVWLTATCSGDRAELKLTPDEVPLWSRIAVPQEECSQGCLYESRCFLRQARQQAEEAHLLVVNHALLLSGIARGGKVLPPYNHIVIDEAHHLEEEATGQLGFRLSQQEVVWHLNSLYSSAGSLHPGGLLLHIRTRLKGSAARRREIESKVEDLCRQVERARGEVRNLFALLSYFVEQNSERERDYERRLRLTPALRRQLEWAQVKVSGEKTDREWEKVEEGLSQLYTALEDLPDRAGLEDIREELSSWKQESEEKRHQTNSLIINPQPQMIYWLSIAEENPCLCAAPLYVGEVLEKHLFSRDSVVLTGATLSTSGDFAYIKERLGLKGARELLLGSPFDYLSSTLLYLPQDIPLLDKPGYQEAVANSLIELCRAAQGHTLALFTSYAALRAVYTALRTPLEREGILALGQGIDGGAKSVVNAFKSNPEALLMGTSSLWEGVDIGGGALKVLVIVRLPFSVPTEPVFAARSELFQAPFSQFALPQAVLRFKQGFGRLIRSRQDKGVVVVLDRRLHSRDYGRAFLDSLPLCTVKTGPWREMAKETREWLAR